MTAFRLLLIAITAFLYCYTAVVFVSRGPNLFPDYIGDIMAMGWPGQFNIDFSTYLILGAVWIGWRHQWSPLGLVLGALHPILGMSLMGPYLLVLTCQTKGDAVAMAIGEQRAANAQTIS